MVITAKHLLALGCLVTDLVLIRASKGNIGHNHSAFKQHFRLHSFSSINNPL